LRAPGKLISRFRPESLLALLVLLLLLLLLLLMHDTLTRCDVCVILHFSQVSRPASTLFMP
jgi:hypothetical protein